MLDFTTFKSKQHTMCYRLSLTKPKVKIEKVTGREFAIPLEYLPQYNVNGFGTGNIHIITQEDPQLIYPSDWGLVPEFAMKDPAGFKKEYNTLNARSESVFKSNFYKKKRRWPALLDPCRWLF